MSVEAISWALNLAPVPAGRGGQPSSAWKYLLTELPVVFSQFRGQADGAHLWFLVMAGCGGQPRDVATLVVPAAGSLLGTGSGWEPYRLVGPDGAVVGAAAAWFQDLRAPARS